MIRLENVTKYYPGNDKPALDNLSLHIRKGEFVFILGSSGAGKSTFIKLLLRETTADSGRVMVGDFNLKTIRNRKIPLLRRSMGVVFQDFRLIPTMTAEENVAFAMRVTNVPEKEIQERVPFVLGLVGLGDKLDRYPEQLSGGEQQRVALARALVHSPKLIIADEPTGNIDPELSVEIMNLLCAINSVGVTVVVVTHEHELVKRFHKRVVQIEHGQVVRDTDPPVEEDSFAGQEPEAGDGLKALNELAEKQRQEVGEAWGTDANLSISFDRTEPDVQRKEQESFGFETEATAEQKTKLTVPRQVKEIETVEQSQPTSFELTEEEQTVGNPFTQTAGLGKAETVSDMDEVDALLRELGNL